MSETVIKCPACGHYNHVELALVAQEIEFEPVRYKRYLECQACGAEFEEIIDG